MHRLLYSHHRWGFGDAYTVARGRVSSQSEAGETTLVEVVRTNAECEYVGHVVVQNAAFDDKISLTESSSRFTRFEYNSENNKWKYVLI